MTEGPRLHAELSASSAYRWMPCPGSIRMIRNLPFEMPPSVYAAEGTAMHLAAAQWLTTRKEPDWLTEPFNGFILEDDAIEAVRFYVNVILDDLATFGGELLVERRFSLATLRKGMFGTNDAMLARCPDGILRVYDFKGGRGVVVEVLRNPQMLYYGYGAVLNLRDAVFNTIELVIVQPRARHVDGPIRRWRVDLLEAYDWSHDLLEAAERTDDPAAPLNAGDWCRFCPAAGVCKAYRDHQLAQAAIDFADPPPPLPDPAQMSGEDLAFLLHKFPSLTAWMNIVVGRAHGELEAGREVPGFRLGMKRGRRQWMQQDRDTIAALHGLGLSDEQILVTELKSPAQVEKAMPRAQRDNLKDLCSMVSTGTKIVPLDDPSPLVEGTGLAVFTPLPGGQPYENEAPP